MFIAGLGAVFFGFVIGWILYRTLRSTSGASVLSDISIIIVAVGGAAVITILKDEALFGWYAIGLVIGFFTYFGIGLRLYGKQEVDPWWKPAAPAPPLDANPPAPAPPPDANPTDSDNAMS
jgi:hypothetical protein